MKRIVLILFSALALIALSNLQAKSVRPNILYFYVDDMGWGSIGPNGQFERKVNGQPHLITPTLDRLAAEGINFRRSYGCTVCSPARSSQQSGFHQGHTFADQNDPDNAKKAMRADDVLMGDALSRAGYVTGYWGKWGYGGTKDQLNPEIVNVQTLPTSHGYDHVLAELHHVRAHTFFQPTLWNAPALPGDRGGMRLIPNSMVRYENNPDYPDTPALQNHPDYPETAYCDDMYAFAALDFVRVQAQNYHATGQPFFGLLAVQIPHAPFGEVTALPGWDEPYRNKPFWNDLSDQAKHWAAMISRIDGHFGNILSMLEDPNGDGDKSDSVADHTLIVFQSDNGGPHHPARVEFDANGGLRESKGRIEEGGIRVPMMIRLPAAYASSSQLKAGSSSDIIFDVTDFLPTFCELAGVEPPLGIDGVSLAPTLLGKGEQRKRDFLIHEAGNGQSIIRGKYKLIRYRTGLALYDLEADPAEENDIAAAHPELVEELKSLLLGERVTEPKGFANTYHHWTGNDGALATDAANWSDYVYENEGIIYTTDAGTPQLSWTAHMANHGREPNHAVANQDLEFLGLEIGGGKAHQSLILDPQVNLTGRNEIRISKHGTLTVNGGVVSSLRWINIHAGGTLKGTGSIEAAVYNDGILSATHELSLASSLSSRDSSTLKIRLNDTSSIPVSVQGPAKLAGILAIEVSPKAKLSPGKHYTVLKSGQLSGAFANPGGQVLASDGTRLKIDYAANEVRVSVVEAVPNIVYLMSDELAYFELEHMGNSKIKTPRIDRMAEEGVRYTRAYAASPVCAPLRCNLMTGKHAGHASVRVNDGGTPMRDEEVTIAEALKDAGYATGGFGKWGVGGRGSTGVPEKQGFDVFYGYYDQVHAHSFYPPYLVKNSEEVPLPGNAGGRSGRTYSHYTIMDDALQFIRDNRDRPFFCYLPITPPHGMYDIPRDDPAWDLYRGQAWMRDRDIDQDAKNYAAMVSMVDRNVGEVLDLLAELGLEKNTLVIFSGDNGGQDRFKSAEYPRGFFGPNVNPNTGAEFRGGKGNLYEGGLRIPFLVRWPGRIASGRVSDHLFYQVDMFPTLVELARASGPDDLDGISILPDLLGSEAVGRVQETHDLFYWEYKDQVAVRRGDWKAIRPGKAAPWELYYLAKDPGETNNLAHADKKRLSELQTLAARAHTDPRPGTFADPDRVLHERDRWAKWGTSDDRPTPKKR